MIMLTTLRGRAILALQEERRQQVEDERIARELYVSSARERFCLGMRRVFGITAEPEDVGVECDDYGVWVGYTIDGIEIAQEYSNSWLDEHAHQPIQPETSFRVRDIASDAPRTHIQSLAELGEYLERMAS